MALDSKNFQKKTVQHIVSLFKKKNRVLLADEVGLGKTIVARDVINELRKEKENFRVLYVCSSQILAAQNIRKLNIDGDSPRLSMLFLNLNQQGCKIIPASPGTSVQTNNAGIKEERLLLFDVLKTIGKFSSKEKPLRQLLKYGCSWNKENEGKYTNQLKSHKKRITAFIKNYLKENDLGKRLIVRLKLSVKSVQEEDRKLICDLRKMLVQYTLSLLNVDLVIMDEFQNFRELLQSSVEKETESEENILYKYFFKDDRQTKILLISATPYRPFTSQSDDENNPFSHYDDFLKLFDFLYKDNKQSFCFQKDIWEPYRKELESISKNTIKTCIKKKKKVEQKLFDTCARTERQNRLCINHIPPKELVISKNDVLAFMQMQNLCKKLDVGNFKLDYAKSTPYVLSFMDDEYVEKRNILNMLKGKRRKELFNKNTSCILLSKDNLDKYNFSPELNSKYSMLSQDLFETAGKENCFERLLWIPPSKYYYEPNKSSIFWKNKNASKILIFSSWRMVPKAIVALTSHESECRLLSKGLKKKYKNSNERIESGTIFEHCSPKLASYFKISYTSKSCKEIKREIMASVKRDVKKIWQKKKSKKFSLRLVKNIVEQISQTNIDCEKMIFDLDRVCNFITDYIIASPIECAYRLCEDEDRAKRIARVFRSMFNRPDANMCIDAECRSKKTYLENVFDYCVQGNLQAVLDEYLFISGVDKDDFAQKVENDYLESDFIRVDTRESLIAGDGERMKQRPLIRTHISTGYYKDSLNNSSSGNLGHKIDAFNSPFRPFIFATTSVGEDGLDFHKYCRKIMHWNLPENPIEFEQREGRINRYCNLAIRQNLCEIFGKKIKCGDFWEILLNKASDSCKKDDESGMSPYWIFPSKYKPSSKIESLIPIFPFSKDFDRLDYIYNIIELYRIGLGQPHQEAVLNKILGLNAPEKQLKQLEMNLSPYFRKKKKQ